MQPVVDQDGQRYLLVKRSSDAWLVRHPETGTERHLPEASLTKCEGESPLETAAAGVPSAVRARLTEPGPRAVGLLAEVYRREPVSVRALLADYDLCESDLHGLLAEFRAAGLVEEVRTRGERCYKATDELSATWN